jgi:chemotaxis family two-component system response regulator Rcp1
LDIKDLTILHVEDNLRLAESVKSAFEHFGFRGDMITAASVGAAIDLLNVRERNKKPLSLIITDMQLPDGTGLDVIREVKTNPAWRLTPVIVLSNRDEESIVNDAYALGANSFMPKVPRSGSLMESLKSFYHYWLENATLPRAGSGDRLQETLETAIGLRTRTSEFYLGLARASEQEPGEMEFWLDRALSAGNLANLLAFFRNKLHEQDVPERVIDQLAGMQMKVKNALKKAEELLVQNPLPSPTMACLWVLELSDAMDEEVFAEACGYLFPKSPVATLALKARAATQLKELALHILDRIEDTELRKKVVSLFAWSQRLGSDS